MPVKSVRTTPQLMANDAYASGSPSNTIREVSVEDMIELYKKIYR